MTGAITKNDYKEITGTGYAQPSASPVEEKQPDASSNGTAGDTHEETNSQPVQE